MRAVINWLLEKTALVLELRERNAILLAQIFYWQDTHAAEVRRRLGLEDTLAEVRRALASMTAERDRLHELYGEKIMVYRASGLNY